MITASDEEDGPYLLIQRGGLGLPPCPGSGTREIQLDGDHLPGAQARCIPFVYESAGQLGSTYGFFRESNTALKYLGIDHLQERRKRHPRFFILVNCHPMATWRITPMPTDSTSAPPLQLAVSALVTTIFHKIQTKLECVDAAEDATLVATSDVEEGDAGVIL